MRAALWYIHIMRQWMRERMRRRRKRSGPNESESTGKVGHEIPANQPAPIQPIYPPTEDEVHAAGTEDAGSGAEPADPNAAQGEAVRREPSEMTETGDRSAESLSEAETENEPQPLSPPPAAAASASKGFVVLAIGLPGSGKSTWFRRRGVNPLSSDMLRGILFDDATDQRFQGLVFSTLRSLLRARLIARMPWNYVDATNLSPHERRQWIKMAKSFGYEAHAVFFDVPCEICMERNRRRDRIVDEETMHQMAERLRPPSFREGFARITMVRVKGSSPSSPPETS